MVYMMGQRLKEARQNKGISQIELARIVGVKPAEISQYESDKRTPRWGVLNKILDELNVSADYMLGREVTVVSDDEEYQIKMSKKDLQLLEELKNSPQLYKILLSDPERNVKVLTNNIKEAFPE